MRPSKWGKSFLVLVAILTAASTFAAAVDTSSDSSGPSVPDPAVDPVIPAVDPSTDPSLNPDLNAAVDPVKNVDATIKMDPALDPGVTISVDAGGKIVDSSGNVIKDPVVDGGNASIFGGIFDGWLTTYGSRLTFEDGSYVENSGRSAPNIINTGSICMDQNPTLVYGGFTPIFQFGCHANDQYGTYSPGGHTSGPDDTNISTPHWGWDTSNSCGFPDSAHHTTSWRSCKKATLRTWSCGPGCTFGFTGGVWTDTACYYYVQASNPPKVFPDIKAGTDLVDAITIKDVTFYSFEGPPETPVIDASFSGHYTVLDWASLKIRLNASIPDPAVFPHSEPSTVGFEYGAGTSSGGIYSYAPHYTTAHPFTPIGYGISWIYETIGGSTSYPISCGVNYAVRAYAQNSSGTAYSNWVDLTVPCPAPIVIMDPSTPRIQLSLTGSGGTLTSLNMFKGKLISAGLSSSTGATSTVRGLGFEYCDAATSGCSASAMPSSASVIYSGAFPGSAFTGGYTSFSTGSFDSIGWGYYTGSGTAGAFALTCGHNYYVRAKASNGTSAYSVAYSPIVSVSVDCPPAPHITTNSYSGSAIAASATTSSVNVTAAMDFFSTGVAPTPAPVSNVTLEYGNATTTSGASTWISGTVGTVSVPATSIVVPASCSTSASSYTLSSSYPIPPTAVPCIQASASLPIPACSGVAQTVYYQFKSTDNLTQTTFGGIRSVSVPACSAPVLSLSSAGATYSFSSGSLAATFQTGTLTSLGSFPYSGLTFRFSIQDAGSASTGTTSAPGGTAGGVYATASGSGPWTFASAPVTSGLCGKRFYYWPSVSYSSSTWFGYDSSGRSGLILMPPCITTAAYSGGTVAATATTASVSANLSMTAASALPVNLFVRSATSSSALSSASWTSASSSSISASGSYSASLSLPACASTPQTIYYEFKADNVSGGASASGGVQSLSRAACPAPSITYPATWTITAGAGGSLSPSSSSYVSSYSLSSCSLSGISINASTGVLTASTSITAATTAPVSCTISASGTGGGSATATVLISVVPAGADHLGFVSPPSSATSGVATSFTVKAYDAFNNPLSSCPSGTLGMSASGATFSGISCSAGTWSGISGTFTTAGSVTVTASLTSLASATTTLTVTAASPVVSLSPSTTFTAAGSGIPAITWQAGSFTAYTSSLGPVDYGFVVYDATAHSASMSPSMPSTYTSAPTDFSVIPVGTATGGTAMSSFSYPSTAAAVLNCGHDHYYWAYIEYGGTKYFSATSGAINASSIPCTAPAFACPAGVGAEPINTALNSITGASGLYNTAVEYATLEPAVSYALTGSGGTSSTAPITTATGFSYARPVPVCDYGAHPTTASGGGYVTDRECWSLAQVMSGLYARAYVTASSCYIYPSVSGENYVIRLPRVASESPLADMRDIQNGGSFSCAVDSSKDLYCWGRNNWGQLGTGFDAAWGSGATHAQKVRGVSNVISLAVSQTSVCVVEQPSAGSATTVKCWGSNISGQVGNGNFSFLVPNGYLTGCSGVSSSCYPQTVGYSKLSSGYLGVNTPYTIPASSFPSSSGFSSGSEWLVQVSMGGWTSSTAFNSLAMSSAEADALTTVCGVSNLGKIYCWGDNSRGQMGIGDPASSTACQTGAHYASDTSTTTTGSGTSACLETVWDSSSTSGAWGSLNNGVTKPVQAFQIASGGSYYTAKMVKVSSSGVVCAVLGLPGSSGSSSYGSFSAGNVVCAGKDDSTTPGHGLLGTNSNTSSGYATGAVAANYPVVVNSASSGTAAFGDVIDLSMSATTACARYQSSSMSAPGVACWGANTTPGSSGTYAFYASPVKPASISGTTATKATSSTSALADVRSVATGHGNACFVVGSSRDVYCQGYSRNLQFGNGAPRDGTDVARRTTSSGSSTYGPTTTSCMTSSAAGTWAVSYWNGAGFCSSGANRCYSGGDTGAFLHVLSAEATSGTCGTGTAMYRAKRATYTVADYEYIYSWDPVLLAGLSSTNPSFSGSSMMANMSGNLGFHSCGIAPGLSGSAYSGLSDIVTCTGTDQMGELGNGHLDSCLLWSGSSCSNQTSPVAVVK